MSSRVIPGVVVDVSYEIVPQQLFPSGVVAMLGTASRGPVGTPIAITNYMELVEIFGPDLEGYTLLKNSKLAFQNGVFQVIAVRVAGSTKTIASSLLKASKKKTDVLKITTKESADLSSNIKIVVLKGSSPDTVRLEISGGTNIQETYENLIMDKNNDLYLVKVLNENSRIVNAESLVDEPNAENHNPALTEITLSAETLPAPGIIDYENALYSLELEPNIDIVYVCDESNPEVHAKVDAHCKNMSLGKEPLTVAPRIGIGTVGYNESVKEILKRKETLDSDRFILVAPYGCAGAVAGLISKLKYFEAPTFKTLTGMSKIERRYTPSEQMDLVSNGILTIDSIKGRGIIIVKGITTNREQINVKRTGDRTVRGIKNISDNFIGLLNNDRKRMALKEKITEFLIAMENEGSIVPSTDMQQPSFVINVYSSQADFAQGIVKVDLAVRPVRAMDYVYATLNVQA
jgi:hypothetical protein